MSKHPSENTQPDNYNRAYPKWLVGTMGLNFLSLLLSPFFLFGGINPYEGGGILRFVGFVAVNLFWVVPCLCFFFALDIWGKGHKTLGIAIGVMGIAVTIAGTYYLWTFF